MTKWPMAKQDWHAQETYKSLMGYGHTMLRFVFVANGGAIVAILTFLGDLMARGSEVPSMRLPVAIFVVGLVLGGVGDFLAYMTQLSLFGEHLSDVDATGWKSHQPWLRSTIFVILLGVAAFAAGALIAVSRLK